MLTKFKFSISTPFKIVTGTMDSNKDKFSKFSSVPIKLLQFGTIWKLEIKNPTFRIVYGIFRFIIRHVLITGPVIFCTAYVSKSDGLAVSSPTI